ncbi:MAG: hypothetical protein WCI11_15585, partial [Candidatus Methylumidiphilus sp.]
LFEEGKLSYNSKSDRLLGPKPARLGLQACPTRAETRPFGVVPHKGGLRTPGGSEPAPTLGL